MFEPTEKNYKTALETTDKPYLEKELFVNVNEAGLPQQRVLIDAEKDMAAHWQVHETTLWIILIVCCLYFLTILFG